MDPGRSRDAFSIRHQRVVHDSVDLGERHGHHSRARETQPRPIAVDLVPLDLQNSAIHVITSWAATGTVASKVTKAKTNH